MLRGSVVSIWFKEHPGWLGMGTVVILFAGLAGACVAILPINLSTRASGPSWCRDQASNRPFVKTVNEAAIGVRSMKAFSFFFHLFAGPPRLGTNDGDYTTVANALEAGASDKIPVSQVKPAQAAAARLDHYCDARVGPPLPTTSTTARPVTTR